MSGVVKKRREETGRKGNKGEKREILRLLSGTVGRGWMKVMKEMNFTECNV